MFIVSGTFFVMELQHFKKMFPLACPIFHFFPPVSAVEGIKSVSSVCVSLTVSALTADPIFGGDIDLDNISNEFEGHRSKVKVARLKT